jgi:ubiquinone/menaquinone biosynthesis C-methylase UbiE
MQFELITPTFCKICDSSESEEILNVTDCTDTYLDYLGIDYSSINRFYQKCLKCGLIYRNIYLSEITKEELYKRFRDVGLRNETHQEYFKRITMLQPKESENFEKYNFLKSFLQDKGKHMDIGGGLGVFCFGFQSFFANWKSICVEPTDGADEIAKKNGVTSYNMYLTENSRKVLGKDFDLITANHVLEHVDKPIDFLKLLKKFIRRKGLICLDLPSSLDIGFLDKSHDRFMFQHEVIYNNKNIEQIAIKSGLKVLYNNNYLSKRGRNNIRAILQNS